MASLAIKGHSTRGSEVIALLEMLGGINQYAISADAEELSFTIRDDDHCIIACYPTGKFVFFTLEQFEEKFPYKVGDKVITDDGDKANIVGMIWDSDIDDVFYDTQICNEVFKYPKELLEPYKEETMGDKLNLLQQLKDYFDNTPREVIEKEWHQYDKYNEIGPKVNEYLEYVNNIRQPKYPKTYEECCKVLGCKANHFFTDFSYNGCDVEISDYENKIDDLLQNFRRLRYCRDAYWKITGEQMGLGKPWEPDWNHINRKFYCIYNSKNNIVKNVIYSENKILAFPTEEMRDAFYENFKELIENCKELL